MRTVRAHAARRARRRLRQRRRRRAPSGPTRLDELFIDDDEHRQGGRGLTSTSSSAAAATTTRTVRAHAARWARRRWWQRRRQRARSGPTWISGIAPEACCISLRAAGGASHCQWGGATTRRKPLAAGGRGSATPLPAGPHFDAHRQSCQLRIARAALASPPRPANDWRRARRGVAVGGGGGRESVASHPCTAPERYPLAHRAPPPRPAAPVGVTGSALLASGGPLVRRGDPRRRCSAYGRHHRPPRLFSAFCGSSCLALRCRLGQQPPARPRPAC